MKKIIILFFIITLKVSGQGVSNRWVMGYACCQTEFGGLDIDFSNDSADVTIQQRYMNINCTVGSICDRNGNLLFVSNGIYVANALDDTMQNGSGINPSAYTTARIPHGLALPQGNLVIPFPDDSTKYYLFHETSDDMYGTWATLYLYYSIIDMTLDGGLGAVIQKNTVLLNDSLVEGRITATKHANGRDWWLVVHQFNTSMVYKYLITPQGISVPTMQDFYTPRDIWFGQALFSPQGTKFAYYEPYGDLDIFDFNRCTGDFTNFVHIDIDDTAFAGGAAFSSSGRYLYLSSVNYIYQLDMLANNIDSSRTTIGVYDGYREQGLYQNFYLAALAPDNKIYINTGNGSKYFHVINSPDSAGLACDFVQRGLPLPRWNAFTIPNYPNYFLGADTGTVCDSLTGITDVKNPVTEFLLFPNPANRDVYLTLSKDKLQSVSVYNSIGQIVLLEHDVIKNEYLHFDVSKLESGFYFVEVVTAKEKVTRKFVRE